MSPDSIPTLHTQLQRALPSDQISWLQPWQWYNKFLWCGYLQVWGTLHRTAGRAQMCTWEDWLLWFDKIRLKCRSCHRVQAYTQPLRQTRPLTHHTRPHTSLTHYTRPHTCWVRCEDKLVLGKLNESKESSLEFLEHVVSADREKPEGRGMIMIDHTPHTYHTPSHSYPHFFMMAGRSTIVDNLSLPIEDSELLSFFVMSSVVYTSPELGMPTWVFWGDGDKINMYSIRSETMIRPSVLYLYTRQVYLKYSL